MPKNNPLTWKPPTASNDLFIRIVPFCAFNVIPEWYRDRIQKKYSITVEEWEEQQGEKLEDGLYRGLMRRGAGDELAAGCAKSQMFHDAEQATM